MAYILKITNGQMHITCTSVAIYDKQKSWKTCDSCGLINLVSTQILWQ